MSTALPDRVGFRAAGGLLVRAVAEGELKLPPWPTLTATGADAVTAWVDWLREVWEVEAVRDAIGLASPVLADRVHNLCGAQVASERESRRVVLSVLRYLARLTGRPTPNGLFAGVTAARFDADPSQRWGDDHRADAAADAGWLAEVIRRLEGQAEILERLVLVANSTLMVRGERLVVPYQPTVNHRGTGAVEVELRYTGPVRAAVRAARTPIPFDDMREQVQAEFPSTAGSTVTGLLATLVARRVLVTNLHAPSTEPDALGHLVRELATVGEAATERCMTLNDIHDMLRRHRNSPAEARRRLRTDAAASMSRLAPSRRSPVTVDLRLDLDVVLPSAVAREAERAALVLARLTSRASGTAAWADFHRRFYQRFGTGAQVPLLEVIADSGIGWPDGYPGTSGVVTRPQQTPRDERLLALAQAAALDGQQEVVLGERLIAELELAPVHSMRLPSHLELCARVDSPSLQALKQGNFQLVVTSVSRSAGVVSGRFLHLFDEHDRRMLITPLAPPASDGVIQAQLSFPPLDPATAHVARSAQVLPTIVSLAEHRDTAASTAVLTAADLAVSCDSDRLYLTAPAL